jgi:hypothetical protein
MLMIILSFLLMRAEVTDVKVSPSKFACRDEEKPQENARQAA